MEIIAHRGASFLAPENTLAGIRLAWGQHADAVEVDLRLTKDGHVVAVHDRTARRTAGKPWIVANHSLRQLRTLDAGRWKGTAWAGERIPALEEILASVPEGKRLFMEIKCGRKIVPALARALAAANKPPQQLPVISFNFAALVGLKAKLPAVPAYWVRTWPRLDRKASQRLRRLEAWIEKCCRVGLEGLDLGQPKTLEAKMVERIHGRGLKVYAWTVNGPEDARRLAAMAVDGITTDRPGWLREELESPTPAEPPTPVAWRRAGPTASERRGSGVL